MHGWLNWRFDDKNLDKKERNYKTLTSSMKGLFFFCLIFIPVIIFSYIVYNNPNLKEYINYNPLEHNNVNEMVGSTKIWDYLDIPNGYSIFTLLWVGYALAFLTIGAIVMFKPFASGKAKREIKVIYINVVVLFATISILMVSLSQYQYSKFFEFYKYEALTTDDMEIKLPWIRDLSKIFTDSLQGPDKNPSFGWEESSIVWWVMFCQIMVIFAIIVSFQNSMFGKIYTEDEYQAYIDTNGDSNEKITSSHFTKVLQNLFKNNDKNIARFMIITSLIIIIPSFVFSLLSTISGTNINSVLSWSYKASSLLDDIDFSNAKATSLFNANVVSDVLFQLNDHRYGQLFATVSLQLIVIGVTLATLFFFGVILLRGKNISNKIFLFQSVILVFELLLLVTVMLISKIYIYRLSDFWNEVNPETNNTTGVEFFSGLKVLLGSDYEKMISMFPIKNLNNNNGFTIEWVGHAATVAESVILYAFIIGSFSIVGYNLLKLGYLDKNNLKKYSEGILNS